VVAMVVVVVAAAKVRWWNVVERYFRFRTPKPSTEAPWEGKLLTPVILKVREC